MRSFSYVIIIFEIERKDLTKDFINSKIIKLFRCLFLLIGFVVKK